MGAAEVTARNYWRRTIINNRINNRVFFPGALMRPGPRTRNKAQSGTKPDPEQGTTVPPERGLLFFTGAKADNLRYLCVCATAAGSGFRAFFQSFMRKTQNVARGIKRESFQGIVIVQPRKTNMLIRHAH